MVGRRVGNGRVESWFLWSLVNADLVLTPIDFVVTPSLRFFVAFFFAGRCIC